VKPASQAKTSQPEEATSASPFPKSTASAKSGTRTKERVNQPAAATDKLQALRKKVSESQKKSRTSSHAANIEKRSGGMTTDKSPFYNKDGSQAEKKTFVTPPEDPGSKKPDPYPKPEKRTAAKTEVHPSRTEKKTSTSGTSWKIAETKKTDGAKDGVAKKTEKAVRKTTASTESPEGTEKSRQQEATSNSEKLLPDDSQTSAPKGEEPDQNDQS